MIQLNLSLLKHFCAWPAKRLATAYQFEYNPTDDYYFKDNDANVLAVAHMDTVFGDGNKSFSVAKLDGKHVVFSPALDDRLGAYTLCEYLPRFGLNYDILLTTGEESMQSSAMLFETKKTYNWMFSFDRAGKDVVMYQYHTQEFKNILAKYHVPLEYGTYSDIADLDTLGCVGFNWGTGYHNQHTYLCHMVMDEYYTMVNKFRAFFADQRDVLYHYAYVPSSRRKSYGYSYGYDSKYWHDSYLSYDSDRFINKGTGPSSTSITKQKSSFSMPCELCHEKVGETFYFKDVHLYAHTECYQDSLAHDNFFSECDGCREFTENVRYNSVVDMFLCPVCWDDLRTASSDLPPVDDTALTGGG